MAASQRDRRPSAAAAPSVNPGAPGADGPEVLPPLTPLQRSRLGTLIAAIGILAVVLSTASAPAPVRAPFVLLAMLLLPGFPFAARLQVDLPTLIAVDVCASLAVEAGLALVTVEAGVWHPKVLGLALACLGVGGTFVALMAARHAEARHLQ